MAIKKPKLKNGSQKSLPNNLAQGDRNVHNSLYESFRGSSQPPLPTLDLPNPENFYQERMKDTLESAPDAPNAPV